jgi:hypothetical protein
MAATRILFYTPILLLTYWYIQYTVAVGPAKDPFQWYINAASPFWWELPNNSNLPDGTFSTDGTERDIRIWADEKEEDSI